MSDKLDRFVNLMKGIFELDKSDLDFGIYRIMNIRKDEIEKFLSEKLPAQVHKILSDSPVKDKSDILDRINEIKSQLGDSISSLPDTVPMVKEYHELQAQLSQGVDMGALESDIYSALYNFFSRYYDEGDFISKRRYKEGVYAIPYEGEEVKLYWANQDQYYIKTSENFKDYTFKVGDYTVHFRIVDATTEQNNNKESDDSKRVFMLFTEDEENFPGISTFEHNADTNEIIIRFVYDIPADKKKKYAEENYKAVHDFIYSNNSSIPVWNDLLAPIPTGKGKEKTTLLEKHMKAYVAKNTFDYFIHKDLKGFLSRELDFFIKSEVMHLDDLDTTDEKRVESYLAKVRAVKRVGKVIIDFLAQIENFQKKLWLKKKFVIETNWCITLDRIDESFYPEIAANKAQIQEWIDMYAVDEIAADLTTVGFTNPPTMEFLLQNQNLVVDTKHFSSEFKEKLIASIDNIDEQTGGLMINSDNYNALSLLQRKYSTKIDGCYIDPPYNTDASEIIYKNGYKKSSWCSLIRDRIVLGKQLLNDGAIQCVTIDDFQEHELFYLLNDVFGKDFFMGTVCIKSNPQGRSTPTGFQISHEYGLFYSNNESKIGTLERNEKQLARYGETDNIGPFEWRNLRAQYSQESATMIFPIFVKKDCSDFRIPKLKWNDDKNEYDLLETPTEDEIISLPIDETGRMRTWKYAIATINQKKEQEFGVRLDRSGKPSVYYKGRMKDEGMQPFTFWDKPEYSASTFGSDILADILGKGKFHYPKSIFAVTDSLKIETKNQNALFLDYFAGSGTTAHAVINMNRSDGGNRKYILVEMGNYFNTVTKPRVKKVTFSNEWKTGKPQNRTTGVSHIMKYMKLESYEDALSNIVLDEEKHGLSSLFGDNYLINYMLDTEAEGSLLDIDAFRTPFDYKLKVTEHNETKEKTIDIVETFNYLIGLTVKTSGAIAYFNAETDRNGTYEGAVRLVKDDYGTYGFKQIEGTTPDGKSVLIIWRTISDDLAESNAALDAYFTKHRINPQDREYDIIYVNGDNNLQNMSNDDESWKVQMTEIEFKKRMFEEE